MGDKRQSYRIQKIIGAILFVPAALFTLFGTLGALFSTDGAMVMLGTLMFTGLPLALGLILYLNANKKLKITSNTYNEKTILRIAAKNNGIITQALLTKDSHFSYEEAGQILNDMSIRGIANVEVNDNGAMEYHFETLKKSQD